MSSVCSHPFCWVKSIDAIFPNPFMNKIEMHAIKKRIQIENFNGANVTEKVNKLTVKYCMCATALHIWVVFGSVMLCIFPSALYRFWKFRCIICLWYGKNCIYWVGLACLHPGINRRKKETVKNIEVRRWHLKKHYVQQKALFRAEWSNLSSQFNNS